MKQLRDIARGPLPLVIACLVVLAATPGCAARKPAEQFSKPKYETSTGAHERRGLPSVRQTWYKRFWFWQRRDVRPNRYDR